MSATFPLSNQCKVQSWKMVLNLRWMKMYVNYHSKQLSSMVNCLHRPQDRQSLRSWSINQLLCQSLNWYEFNFRIYGIQLECEEEANRHKCCPSDRTCYSEHSELKAVLTAKTFQTDSLDQFKQLSVWTFRLSSQSKNQFCSNCENFLIGSIRFNKIPRCAAKYNGVHPALSVELTLPPLLIRNSAIFSFPVEINRIIWLGFEITFKKCI